MPDPSSLQAVAFMADGALPYPFIELARLGPGLAAGTSGRPALLHAWTALSVDGADAVDEGALRTFSGGMPALRATGKVPAQGAGLACLLACDIEASAYDDLPRVLSPGIDLRLLAGCAFGRDSPILRGMDCSLALLKLARMMRFELRPDYSQRVVAVAAGSVQMEGAVLEAGALVRIPHHKTLFIDALAPSVLVLCAGQA